MSINIFNLLSVGNKELVHSAMLKFLIENKATGFAKEFFKIPDSELTLEESFGKGRLDIVGRLNGEIEFIIENKYKATPTVKQLKAYDDYCKDLSLKRKKIIKILMVFSQNQVPSDVIDHCIKQEWELRSYFSSIKNTDENLLNYLEGLKEIIPVEIDEKKQILINDYYDYLKENEMVLNKFINNYKYFSYKEIENDMLLSIPDFNTISSRLIGFQYLLYIQAKISKEIIGIKDIYSDNDGGKNVIPSIAFWYNSKISDPSISNPFYKLAYFGIDGDSIKVGLNYERREESNNDTEKFIEKVKEKMKDQITFKSLILQNNNKKIKSIKVDKMDVIGPNTDNKPSSVHSIYCFITKEEALLDHVVQDCADLAKLFFTTLSEI